MNFCVHFIQSNFSSLCRKRLHVINLILIHFFHCKSMEFTIAHLVTEIYFMFLFFFNIFTVFYTRFPFYTNSQRTIKWAGKVTSLCVFPYFKIYLSKKTVVKVKK